MSDKERVITVLKYANMSVNAFSKHIGLKTPQNLYDIIKGKHGISKQIAEKITIKYLNINKAWLITGDGEMLNDNLPPISKKVVIEIGSEVFKEKIISLYENGDIIPAQILAEKELEYKSEIEKLNRLIGKLEAKIEELSLKKEDAHPEDNADYAAAK